jgi:hypothetical protein
MLVIFLRLLLVVLIFLFFSVAFLGAFGKPFDPEHASRDGLIIGFMSALAWGLSVFGTAGWNGFFNFFAALLAAISLAHLTAIKDVCLDDKSAKFLCDVSTWIASILK